VAGHESFALGKDGDLVLDEGIYLLYLFLDVFMKFKEACGRFDIAEIDLYTGNDLLLRLLSTGGEWRRSVEWSRA
jgi:hypothetical protein